jgi:hypothetical protein
LGDLVIEILTGPAPSVMKVIVRAVPVGFVCASSIRSLNVTDTMGALAGAVGVAVGPTEAVGVGTGVSAGGFESVGEIPDGEGLPTLAASDGPGVGGADSPVVASRAPAAMIRITHATPRTAESVRQLESFT